MQKTLLVHGQTSLDTEITTIKEPAPVALRIRELTGSKALFLDRDGVLTRERADYVKTADELELLPGISQPLKDIRDKGFLLVIITNQSAVGRGLTSSDQIIKIHEKLSSELERLGCKADAIYYCPHRPEDQCDCRKPKPGLLFEAARDLCIDLTRSWMIGDKDTDIEAAQRAGCRGIKIPTNDGNLAGAVRAILNSEDSGLGI